MKKLLIFGLDGNLLDNYSVKADCAGRALQEAVEEFSSIKKDVGFFSKIYVETSGMNCLKQFRIAFDRAGVEGVPENILEKTEKAFRQYLKDAEKRVKLFEDAEWFLKNFQDDYFLAVTTTVPVDSLSSKINSSGIDKYINLICARGGVLDSSKPIYIDGFDKGPKHYDFLSKWFNVDCDYMIAVSSTRKDISNAKCNGLVSVAVEHIFDKAELEKLNPDFLIENFYQLPLILNKIEK